MKDEIKEILKQCDGVVEREIPLLILAPEYTQLLLDYITNLQEENERLKEKVHNQKVANAYEIVQIDKLQTNIKTQIRRRKKEAQLKRQYKSRIDEAIEYNEKVLKENWYGGYEKENATKNIKILQGKSEE